ncbi:MAG: hypothetical protein GF404_00035 [candidate division Zixibacteria bacterium]|nr:hypothetical protein [candidate division Zixibacteria bacterium]
MIRCGDDCRIFGKIFLFASLLLVLWQTVLFAESNTLEIELDSNLTTINLPDRNIFKNTLRVYVDNELYDIDSLARIDYSEGVLFFEDSLQADTRLNISYEYLSYDLPDYFRTRELSLDNQPRKPPPEIDDPETKSTREDDRHPHDRQFHLSGSKSVSVTAGNLEDLDLDQTLSLKLSGEPVEGVRLTGALSDEARPEAGGISSSLEDIDAVWLKLESKYINSQLGDLNYKNRWGDIARFDKRLKGVDLNLSTIPVSARATLSGLKGKFRSVRITPREGVNGPYVLRDDNNQRVALVGGSERVYLDGRLLTSGASNDYVIDYARAEITFTPRITLSSRSRLVVDYEYLDQSYRRGLNSIELTFKPFGENLRLSSGYLDYSDDESRPVDFSPSDSDLVLLRSAGDNRELAVRDGATKVEKGMGDFIQKTDSSGNLYYEFAGIDQGDYDVRFTRVEAGQGEYVYRGGGNYLYLGPGQGNYLPLQYLPLPESNRAVFGRIEAVADRWLEVDTRMALSDHDKNSFSVLDDVDNEGVLIDTKVSLTPVDSTSDSKFISGIKTDLKYRSEDAELSLPGRLRQVERERKWGLPVDTIYDRAEEFEISQKITVLDSVRFDADWGKYKDRNRTEAERYKLGLSLSLFKNLRFTFLRADRLSELLTQNKSGRLYNDQVELKYAHKDLVLSLGWEDESDDRPELADSIAGIRFNKYIARVQYDEIALRFSQREQSSLQSLRRNTYIDRTLESKLEKRLFDGNLILKVDLAGRYLDYRHNDLSDLSEIKTSSSLRIELPARLGNASLSYRLNRQQVSRLAKNFIKVAEGQGNYRLEDSIYVPDPLGDYIAVDEFLGADQVGLKSDRSLSLDLDLMKILGKPGMFRRMQSETVFNLREEGDQSYRLNLLYLWPSWRIYPDWRLFSDYRLRQYFRIHSVSGWQLTLGYEETLQNDRIHDRSGEKHTRLYIGRMATSLNAGIDLRVEYNHKREKENSGYFGQADFVENDFKTEFNFCCLHNVRLRISPRYLTDRSDSDDLSADLVGASIEPGWELSKRGRLQFDFSYYNVSEKNDRRIPYQFAAGNRPGDNYRWGASLKINYNQSITSQLTYRADRIAGLSTRHKLTVSMRATF